MWNQGSKGEVDVQPPVKDVFFDYLKEESSRKRRQ